MSQAVHPLIANRRDQMFPVLTPVEIDQLARFGERREFADLSGRPALVDGVAMDAVEAVVIPSRRLRDLMVEEAELGERIMRALILRRVGLLDTGAGGPVIVGDADNADVLRLEGFLARNAHPHRLFAPSGKARRWWRRCMDIWRGAGVVRWGWRFRGGGDWGWLCYAIRR